MPFTLWFDDVCSLPAEDVLDRVRKAEKKPLGDLLVYDLLADGNRPLFWGVYFFFSKDGTCLYVGKNSSQKFVSRIPIHLGLHPKEWMNHLVGKICRYEDHDCQAAAVEGKRAHTTRCLTTAVEAARTHTLLLLAVGRKEQKLQIAGLETFFRVFAEPKYNKLKRRKCHARIDLKTPLIEVLKYQDAR